jgi:lactam utilization protein B
MSPVTAATRGVNERYDMAGNLLQREVTAEDVAQAFRHQALELKTTGDVTTADGGNIAAALRSLCLPHAQDDPNSSRTGRTPPEAEGQGGSRGGLVVRLPA